MKFQLATIVLASGLFLSSCGSEEKPTPPPSSESENPIEETQEEVTLTGDLAIKGVGPIKSLKLEEVDKYLAESGKDLFKTNCTACHKFSDRHIGPALSGIMDRRSPEWIMNMILNPEIMVQQDSIAKSLFEEYNSPMSNQGLSQDDARAVLEYMRTRN